VDLNNLIKRGLAGRPTFAFVAYNEEEQTFIKTHHHKVHPGGNFQTLSRFAFLPNAGAV
jgi:hypothetical protein